MTNRQDVDRVAELLNALDVDVSSVFVARVRERVRAASAARLDRRRFWGRVVLASAAAGTAVIALAWARWSGHTAATPAFVAERSLPPAAGPGRVTSRPATVIERQESPIDRQARAADERAVGTLRPRPARAIPTAARPVHEPDVLVPDDQRLALARLMSDLRAGRAVVPPTVGPTFDADGQLVVPALVMIPPLPDPSPKPADRGAGEDKDKR